jgi:hypothetical protein
MPRIFECEFPTGKGAIMGVGAFRDLWPLGLDERIVRTPDGYDCLYWQINYGETVLFRLDLNNGGSQQ